MGMFLGLSFVLTVYLREKKKPGGVNLQNFAIIGRAAS